MSYLSPHAHTDMGSNLRLIDSTNKVDKLIQYSHDIGLKGVCITDHEAVTAHVKALQYVKKHKEELGDFKLGLGNEIYLCTENVTSENIGNNTYPHFILIALDEFGHQGIRELSTKAWTQNAFMHVMYRVPTYYKDLEEMMMKYKGHIVGSTACIGGALPRRILYYDKYKSNDVWQSCLDWIDYMNDIFGKGYFFLELQPGQTVEQITVNNYLIKLSKESNTPYIISTDAHYLKKEDRNIHKTYLLSKDGDREDIDAFYETTYIMDSNEIHQYMDSHLGYDTVQKGLDNTLIIYDMLQDYSLEKELHIPYIPLNTEEPDPILLNKFSKDIPLLNELYKSEYDSDRHMLRELLIGIDKDITYQTEEGYKSITECLDTLISSSEKMKVRWSAYLMQVADYVRIAWETGTLVGAGRGSGVGFCLLNLLNIIQVNPLRENTKTFYWRFLNPERASVLDIDIDIESNARDKVINALKDVYGNDRVSKVMTMSTEKSKQAILTAARGLGIDNDTSSYIASLVIFDRGQARTLSQMYYGDDDYSPSAEFVREMDAHPDLWEAAQSIEGLVSNISSHAGGVVIVDEPFTNTTALMRTKAGDIVTQFELHDSESLSNIKIDLLCIDALDKIHATLDLLLKDGLIEWQGTLKDTYEKYIGIYNLERTDKSMWELLWNHKVLSLFQMEKDSGKRALALVKPNSVDDLATINSVIRLMAQEKGAETPLEKFARFHDDITLWYKEMEEYGLTEEEQQILKDILEVSFGICEAQEYLVLLTMHPKIGGFSLAWADMLRKAVSKKKANDFIKLEKDYYENAKVKNLSPKLIDYVWKCLIYTQRGYGFNKSHTLAYSLIGLQELNLAYRFNIIYWNCANLIVDSGSLDEESNDSTNYGKTGIAISAVQKENIKVALPTINEADFGFKPDTKNEQIIFGLKGIKDINTDLAQTIIKNRPYSSMEDFVERMVNTGLVQDSKMFSLIKGGCFTELHNKDRRETMKWYLENYVLNKCSSLTLSQLPKMIKMNMIPEELEIYIKMLNFKKYVLDDNNLFEKHIDPDKKMVKRGYHDGYYKLDDNSQPFFKEHFTEDSIVKVQGKYYIVSEKLFIKEVDSYILPLKEWFSKEETLTNYNIMLLNELYNKHAKGSVEKWNMEALTYYDAEHELEHINEDLYGIVNFFDLPEEPEAYEYYTKYINGIPKQMPKYRISCIAGTVLNADKDHSQVALLTKYGTVNIKINKGHFSFYNKRISVIGEDGKKTVIEDSWLKRGTLLRAVGIRRGDQFFLQRYNDTIYQHTLNRIIEVNNDGTMLLQNERTKIGDSNGK